jgi:hypothetical protein
MTLLKFVNIQKNLVRELDFSLKIEEIRTFAYPQMNFFKMPMIESHCPPTQHSQEQPDSHSSAMPLVLGISFPNFFATIADQDAFRGNHDLSSPYWQPAIHTTNHVDAIQDNDFDQATIPRTLAFNDIGNGAQALEIRHGEISQQETSMHQQIIASVIKAAGKRIVLSRQDSWIPGPKYARIGCYFYNL